MAIIDLCIHGKVPAACEHCSKSSDHVLRDLAQGQIDWMRRFNEKCDWIRQNAGENHIMVKIPTVEELISDACGYGLDDTEELEDF